MARRKSQIQATGSDAHAVARARLADMTLAERWEAVADGGLAPTPDDTPVLAEHPGRRATAGELRSFVAREQRRLRAQAGRVPGR
jgi:hypothetical protein